MNIIKSSPRALSSAGILSAIAASLCCITPVVALLAGTSSMAANFLWIEPARPYLIALSIVVLAFAWYLKLKPLKSVKADCTCETTKTSSFLQTKSFLGFVTLFAILMMTFPLYAKVFYLKPEMQRGAVAAFDKKQQVKFTIEDMTCKACEDHVNIELSKVAGVLAYKTSYASKNSFVTFDSSKVDIKTIEAAINKTGYTVKDHTTVIEKN